MTVDLQIVETVSVLLLLVLYLFTFWVSHWYVISLYLEKTIHACKKKPCGNIKFHMSLKDRLRTQRLIYDISPFLDDNNNNKFVCLAHVYS